MQVFHDLASIKKDNNTVLTIGTFDGIHLGHRNIIEKVKKNATIYGARNFVVTFNPHPRKILSEANNIKILSTLREKTSALESLGIENLYVIEFTKEFSQLAAEKFFSDYIIKGIGLKEIIIGYDYHFGKGRGGSVETLMEMGKGNNFSVNQIEEIKIDGDTVSSTKIRNALVEGNIELANKYLGGQYSFSGIVVSGDRRGRTLGFPTANIQPDDPEKLLPALGIYLVEILISGKSFFGLLSVGKRPTFYDEGKIIPEVYIYDFDEDIYDEYVTVNVIERLRGEEKFSSAEELIEQMNKDKASGLEILSKKIN
jgi:riboflavin kinase / FMN adenylyltransferase